MTFYANKNFVWDANNRLTHVYSTSIPGQIARYYYSAMNNRVMKTVDSDNDGLLDSSTVYIYCGQKVCEEQNENGGFKRDYIHGGQFIDEIVMTCDSPSGLGSFSLTDLRYSVYAVVNSSGVILERYQYDPYGKRKVMNAGYGEMKESSIGQEFGYTGRRHDSEATGLMYFRARMYSCDLGRFVGRDPLSEDLIRLQRLYRYFYMLGSSGISYHDGMNLYQSYFTVNGTDWDGHAVVKKTVWGPCSWKKQIFESQTQGQTKCRSRTCIQPYTGECEAEIEYDTILKKVIKATPTGNRKNIKAGDKECPTWPDWSECCIA